jgi:uncharacterized protein
MQEHPIVDQASPAASVRSTAGAIDCDFHLAIPGNQALVPYLEPYWREMFVVRGIDRTNMDLSSYPPNSPLCGRPDWRPKTGVPGSDFERARQQGLDGFGTRFAICNCLHGAQTLFSEDFAAAMCRAVNDYIAKEWLDREPRLRASIVVPTQNPEMAAEEIERLAGDRRFVQVLMLLMGDKTLGHRYYWPIYRAAEKYGLPIGIHAGSMFRQALSPVGWSSYYLEDYVLQAQAFESQLLSMVVEGVFAKFPALKIVMIESGISWLPNFLWRANKTWRGVRIEVPWVKQPPAEIVRNSVRFTLQPFDEPPDSSLVEKVIDQIGSDELLLFSTDYPHWHYDGYDDVLPKGLPPGLAEKIMIDNPLKTYIRLGETRLGEAA